ncbi:MAG: hypothetical protein JWM78_1005 [Verrucomicrobiaceae bacterium]|nr:hypothetical protein [Verrucomicrobiaceae bacterium]
MFATTISQRISGSLLCAVFAITAWLLVSRFSAPTPFQAALFRAVLAFEAAGAVAMLPSYLQRPTPAWLRFAIALAALFIVFFFNPALPVIVH